MLDTSPLTPIGIEKNIDERKQKYRILKEGLLLDILPETGAAAYRCMPGADIVQYYFSVGGAASFHFNQGRYVRHLEADHAFLIYQPVRDFQMDIVPEAGTRLVCVFLSIERLHDLFLDDMTVLHFLEPTQIHQAFYEERPLSPGISLILNQLLNREHIPVNDKLYFTAKVYELLSIYFDRGGDDQAERCPFLLNEEHIEKIRQARQIVQDQMLDPPSLKSLARSVGLNEYQLKAGFKNIYGCSVFQYLNEYKMEYARRLLDKKIYHVNEVSDQIGYSNPSHFIVAFKRKFGVTPKKYLMALR